MACPFFDPVQPRGSASDSRFAMLPLGNSWTGMCLADPRSPAVPDEYRLHHTCNLGYAREQCPRFARADAPDAVRFALATHEGGAVRVRWATERDHRPLSHGTVAFDPISGRLDVPEGLPESVARLATAYVASYLRRRDLEQ